MATDLRRDRLLPLASLLLVTAGCGSHPPVAELVTSPEIGTGQDPAVKTPAPSPHTPVTATLPTPVDLGPGWSYRIEPNEQGGPVPDSPFQERDPTEVVLTSIPLGCDARNSPPAPNEVRQATYRHRASGTYAVALRLQFDTTAVAARFVEKRATALAACRDQPDDPFSGAPSPVLDVTSTNSQTTARYELLGEAGTWTSAMKVQGSTVLRIETNPDKPDLVDWAAVGFRPPS